jgi:hypothetical protein
MSQKGVRASLLLWAMAPGALVGCSLVLGIDDLPIPPADAGLDAADARTADERMSSPDGVGPDATQAADAMDADATSADRAPGADAPPGVDVAIDGPADVSVDGPVEAGCGRSDAGNQLVACGASCVDIENVDPANCGACGHSCQGGTCAAGRCQPLVLATGQSSLLSLAVDTTNVYWSGGRNIVAADGAMPPAGVLKCAIGGCGQHPLALPGAIWAQAEVASDGTDVYYNTLDFEGLLECSISGCAGGTQIQSDMEEVGLAVDPLRRNVYWIAQISNEGVYRYTVGGAVAVSVTPDSQTRATTPLAADANYVYFVEVETSGASEIEQCAVNSAFRSCVTLAVVAADASTSASISSLVVNASTVYWSQASSTGGSIWSCAIGGCAGTPSLLASDLAGDTLTLAADDAHFYYAAPTAVEECPVSGPCSAPVPVASGLARPEHLVSDATSLYWVNADDGTLVKAAKP